MAETYSVQVRQRRRSGTEMCQNAIHNAIRVCVAFTVLLQR